MSIAGQACILSGFAGGASSGLFLFSLLASLGYTALAFVRLMFIRPESEEVLANKGLQLTPAS